MWGFYVHWPFCLKKCPYCDFFTTYPFPDLVSAYLDALELEIQRSDTPRPLEIGSLYLGGGTPSLMTPPQLTQLLTTLRENFSINKSAEVTLEANPENLTPENLRFYQSLGINRLSLGAQSFAAAELKLLGRSHSGAQVKSLVRSAQEAGIKNISLDLMFALPNQTLGEWEANLRKAVSLNVEHLSLYCLTWAEKTVFRRLKAQNKLRQCPEELEAAMYQLAQKLLAANGYSQYEISSFAKEGFTSAHNQLYWRDQPYIGLGAGAAGYDGITRRYNVCSVREYNKRLQHDLSPVETRETLTGREKMQEMIFLALRTTAGLNRQAFQAKFHEPPEQQFGAIITELVQNNCLVNTSNSIYIPAPKLIIADAIIKEFMV